MTELDAVRAYRKLEFVPDGEMGFDPGGREVKQAADAAIAALTEALDGARNRGDNWKQAAYDNAAEREAVRGEFKAKLAAAEAALAKGYKDREEAAAKAEKLLTEEYEDRLDAEKTKRRRAERRAEKWEWIATHEVTHEVVDTQGREVPTIEEREEWELDMLKDASEDRP